MRILLDAYFDSNFGDDLFVHTLLNRYPDDLFYVFWDKEQPDVLKRALKIPNLVIMPGECAMLQTMHFDGYVMIGGDVLPDGIDYSRRIGWMQHVKNQGGFVAMLGFSLYEFYGEKTKADFAVMARLADTIVIRDRISAQRFQSLVPEADVTESTDMAFTGIYEKKEHGNQILGISARRKLYSTDEEHTAYCRTVASVADKWLVKDSERKVRFLALSTGEYDDRVTSADVIRLMEHQDRTEIVEHTAGIDVFLSKVRECSAMLATRFHALVFALIYEISFVPIPYEAKLTQLLDELGYTGTRIPYGKEISEEVAWNAAAELDRNQTEQEKLQQYCMKAGAFFGKMDQLMKTKRNAKEEATAACSMVCRKPQEIEQLKADLDYARGQERELSAWVASLQNQRDDLLRKIQEMDDLRIQQVEQWQNQYQELDNLRIQQVEQWQNQYQELDSLRIQQVEQWQNQYQELDQKVKLLTKRFPPAKLLMK